jgi:uncharacterized membrane protein (UPF0127 family)
MPWLVNDGRVVASLEIADSRRSRRVGLLGRDGIDGALLLTPARSVHTIRMRFAIDVVHLDRNLVVLSVVTMKPGRIGRWRRRCHSIIETEAGCVRVWDIHSGDHLEIRS